MTKRGIPAIMFAVALPLACNAAHAADPSVDDILSALKPKAGALSGTTRGIRAIAPGDDAPSADAPSAAPHAHRVKPVRPAARQGSADAASSGEGPSLDLTIVFRTGSTDLTPAASTTLAKLGKALASPSLAAYRFRIEGHTDTVGTKEANQALSQARAEKVASFLEHDFGITPDRLQPVGLGEDGLLVPTPDQTPEPQNRRVHVVNLGS
jgi:outer membrane protein OmpA-like peptidoglycan-associated protein